jgi:hypothetical protein
MGSAYVDHLYGTGRCAISFKLRRVESHLCFALDIADKLKLRRPNADKLSVMTNRFALAIAAFRTQTFPTMLRSSIDSMQTKTELKRCSTRGVQTPRMRCQTFRWEMLHSIVGMQTKSKGPSMLKFGLGVVVGIFIGIYLAASLPRELGELFAWLSLGTILQQEPVAVRERYDAITTGSAFQSVRSAGSRFRRCRLNPATMSAKATIPGESADRDRTR